MIPYKLLVTGVGISGKSNLAKKLEKDLSRYYNPIANKDVDWDRNALIVPNSGVYILQTPEGCQAETKHGISLADFNKIIYCDPDVETYIQFLISRGCAWFREGVIEKGLDKNPQPYSLDKLPRIFKRILEYAFKKEELKNEDMDYFNRPNLREKLIILRPIIESPSRLAFEGYDNMLEQIIGEAKSWLM